MIIDDYSNPHEIETYRVMTSLVGFVFSILSCFFFGGAVAIKDTSTFYAPKKGACPVLTNQVWILPKWVVSRAGNLVRLTYAGK